MSFTSEAHDVFGIPSALDDRTKYHEITFETYDHTTALWPALTHPEKRYESRARTERTKRYSSAERTQLQRITETQPLLGTCSHGGSRMHYQRMAFPLQFNFLLSCITLGAGLVLFTQLYH
jgi:hypothetical protein